MKKFLPTYFMFFLIYVNTYSQPVALRPGIVINHLMNVRQGATRLAYNTIDHSYYYSTMTGNIYKIILAERGQVHDTLIYTIADHAVQYVQGMAFHDSALYVSGNNNKDSALTTGIIRRGNLVSGNLRTWTTVAQTVPYETAGVFDHLFSGLTLNPHGDTILICSGSRGDNGEVQTRNGLYPGRRNLPLTSLILQIPSSAVNLAIPNDSAQLISMGLVFVYGIRNTFDFGYNAKGDLFGVENSCDRDMEDEINWLRKGKNYGFPWMMGGTYNPQQYPSYNPSTDLLINHNSWAWSVGAYCNDPAFPQIPSGLELTKPCINYGPDAAFMRNCNTGATYNAAANSEPVYGFTPHRSPLGITFDCDSALGGNLRGKCFVLSYTRGNGALNDSSALMVPFNDTGEDLLMLDMQLDTGINNYTFHAYKIVQGFNHPVDAVLRDSCMYVIEVDFNGQQSLWRLDFPSHLCKPSSSEITQTACGSFTLNGQKYIASGSYTQTLVSAAGCDSIVTLNLTIKPLPSVIITAAGPLTFCSGGSVVLNTPDVANRSYQWKKGALNISGATMSSYTATAGGSYKVTVINTNTGCLKTTATGTVVTVNSVPSATITPQGPTSFCAGGSVVLHANAGTALTYQWKKGTNNIGGATLQNYIATIGGNYKVQVTNGIGCTKLSAGVAVTVSCREEEEELMSSADFAVSVFPNPANSEINIILPSGDNFEIEILNKLGERIITEKNENKIDISNLSNGVYFIKVFQRNNFVTQKFIKQ